MPDLSTFLATTPWPFSHFYTTQLSLERPEEHAQAILTLRGRGIIMASSPTEIDRETTIILTFSKIRHTDFNFIDHGFFEAWKIEELSEHSWLLQFQRAAEIWCYAPVPQPFDFLRNIEDLFYARHLGHPFAFRISPQRSDAGERPFFNYLGDHLTLHSFTDLLSQNQFSLCKGPESIVRLVAQSLEKQNVPFRLLHATDLDPFDSAENARGSVKLYRVGWWEIFAESATIEFPDGMANFA